MKPDEQVMAIIRERMEEAENAKGKKGIDEEEHIYFAGGGIFPN